jgi:hypothetical protein
VLAHRVIGLALLTACASAGSGAPDELPIDARVEVDAPLPPIDGASNTCASAATCPAAMMLGSVSGDTGNAKLGAMGHQSAWFRVRVTENDSDILGLTLRAAAKLTSPTGSDFDVFVYVNTGSDVVECSTTIGTTTTNGTVNETRAEWGEGTIPNGSDDGRDISLEVRPISTSCAPDRMWQLEVEGNWN